MRICKGCNLPLHTEDKRQKYCSRECFEDSKRERDRIRLPHERNRHNAYAALYRQQFPEKVKAAIERSRSTPEGQLLKKASDWAWHQANREHANANMVANYRKNRIFAPWAVLIHAAKARAKKRGQPFDLTMEWAKSRWTGFCEVSRLPFVLGARGKSGGIYSPSIDKIIPSLGYTQNNCRIVLFAVNALKHDGTDDDMFRIAEALISNRHQEERQEAG